MTLFGAVGKPRREVDFQPVLKDRVMQENMRRTQAHLRTITDALTDHTHPSLDWTMVMAKSDLYRISDTTLRPDEYLWVDLQDVATYSIRGKAFFDVANANMDYKFDLNFTGALASAYCRDAYSVAGVGAGTDNETVRHGTALPTSTSVPGITSGFALVQFDLVVAVAVAGRFSLRWAQDTSDAARLTRKAGSYLEYMAV